jgi:hypothetical protein
MSYLFSFLLFSLSLNIFAADYEDIKNNPDDANITELSIAPDKINTDIIASPEWGKPYLYKIGHVVELHDLAKEMLKKFAAQDPKIIALCYPYGGVNSVEEYWSIYEHIKKKSIDSLGTESCFESESFAEGFCIQTALFLGYGNGPQFALFYDSEHNQSALFFKLDQNTPNFIRDFLKEHIKIFSIPNQDPPNFIDAISVSPAATLPNLSPSISFACGK